MWFSLFSEQTCPRCGAKAPHDAVSCPLCGYWLHPTSYLPVLTVVILAALLDIGLIVWRGVPRSALAISASELPTVLASATDSLLPPPEQTVQATALAHHDINAIVPSSTPIPTTPPAATPTALPTVAVPATATARPTATPMATSTALPTPTAAATATPAYTATAVPTATMPATATAVPTVAAPPPDGPDTHDEHSAGDTVLVSLDLSQGSPVSAEALMPPGTASPDIASAAASVTAVAPTAEPTATPAEGQLWLRNYIGSELVVTVTSQDVIWATTFRVAPMGETTIALAPGRYTYTASPLGGGDQHGEFILAAGQKLEMPIVGG